MRMITYSYLGTGLQPWSEPIAWRIGYTMADEIVAACVPETSLFLLQRMTEVTDTKRRIIWMQGHFKNEDENLGQAIKEQLQTYKTLYKIKHKTKEVL